MKNCLFLILLISFATSLQAQEVVPPGTVRLNDTLFIEKGPVDNMMYREFTEKVLKLWSYTLHDSLKTLELKNIPKSLLTTPLNPVQSIEIYNRIKLEDGGILTKDVDNYTYWNHPKYYHHPVTGVSKEQAELFCQWRTDMVNLLWSTKLKRDPENYRKIAYRLPTVEEYELAKRKFLNDQKLLVLDEGSPLNMDLEILRKKDNLIFYDTAEFTSSNKKYLDDSFEKKEVAPSKPSYTFFRCICEVQ